MRAGSPAVAARLRDERLRHAGRALEYAVATDPTFRDRYDELGLRRLLNDAVVLMDALAVSVASGDVAHVEHWADMSVPVYRRRRVPLEDLVHLAEGLRRSVESGMTPDEIALADAAIDGAIVVWRRDRRLGGDARKRNPILAAIYKGA